MEHEACLKLAIEEAFTGIRSGDGGPFGAVIFRNGKVIDYWPIHSVIEIRVPGKSSKKCHGIDRLKKELGIGQGTVTNATTN